MSTASLARRQRTGQPKNVSVVPLATTSPFQGGPTGVELVSVFQVMLLRPTVTLPAEPVNSVPTTAAEADGANVVQASTAKLKTPNFSTFRFFNVFLRKVQGHYPKLWAALGIRIRTLNQLVNEPICAEWTMWYQYSP